MSSDPDINLIIVIFQAFRKVFRHYFFILGLKRRLAKYPKISAADVPTAPALNPPRKSPIKPGFSTLVIE